MDRHTIDPAPVLEALRGLGQTPQEVSPLGVNAWNAHFRLALEGHDAPLHLVVYRLPDPEAVAGLRFEHQVLRWLRAQDFDRIPTPLVIDDESLFRWSEGWFAVTRWVDGCRGDDDPPLNRAQRQALAGGLADLHRALAGFERRLDYHHEHVFVYPLPAVIEQRTRLLGAVDVRVTAWEPAAQSASQEARPRVEQVLTEFPRGAYDALFPGVVHGDFRGLNAAFDGDALTTLLDFNCSFNELRLWDVAYTALGLGGKETVGLLTDLDRPAAFVADYHAASPLSDAEWALLPAMLCVVPAKLMLAAVAGWWITDRAAMLAALIDGDAQRIVDAARRA